MTTALEQETEMYEEVARNADIDPEAFEAFCRNQHIKPENSEDAISDFQDSYIGQCDSAEDFIHEYLWEEDDLSSIPAVLVNHINWNDVWECEYRHDFYEINGYYFRNI